MGEEELPIFKSEGEAFDRAKINSEVAKGNVGALTSEVGDSMRAADKVSKEAKIFFDKIFNEELKALDPAYDPKEIAYQYAYSQSGSHKKSIERSIEKGEAVDGKEIAETAKADAKNKTINAAILKSGSVTQIVENIGRSKLEQMDLFEDVKGDFDSKIKNEKFQFETLSKNLGQIISYFNDAQAGQNASNLYTVENRAILAAFAKILEGEGFNSELVKKSASSYDKHMLDLIEKDKGGSVESIPTSEKKDSDKGSEAKTAEQTVAEKEAPKNTTGAEAKTAEQSLAEKEAPKNTTGAEAKTVEQTAAEKEAPKNTTGGETKESTTVVSTPTELTPTENNSSAPDNTSASSPIEGSKSETLESPKKTESAPSNAPSVTGTEKSVEGNNEKEMVSGSKSGADFLSSIFGISGNTEKTESKETEKIENATGDVKKSSDISDDSKKSSSISTEAQLESKVESNTSTKSQSEPKLESNTSTKSQLEPKVESNTSKSAKSPLATKMESNTDLLNTGIKSPIVKSALSSATEKISKFAETSIKNDGIKETVTQKLSSLIPKQENNDSSQKKDSSTTESSGTSSVQKQNETSVESSNSTTEAKTENAKDDSSEKGKSEDKNNELSSKMDMMVSLLAQLNDTMSGPLLITSSKKFE